MRTLFVASNAVFRFDARISELQIQGHHSRPLTGIRLKRFGKINNDLHVESETAIRFTFVNQKALGITSDRGVIQFLRSSSQPRESTESGDLW